MMIGGTDISFYVKKDCVNITRSIIFWFINKWKHCMIQDAAREDLVLGDNYLETVREFFIYRGFEIYESCAKDGVTQENDAAFIYFMIDSCERMVSLVCGEPGSESHGLVMQLRREFENV